MFLFTFITESEHLIYCIQHSNKYNIYNAMVNCEGYSFVLLVLHQQQQ